MEVKGEARARGTGRVGRGRTVVSGKIRATVSERVIQSLSVREAGQRVQPKQLQYLLSMYCRIL